MKRGENVDNSTFLQKHCSELHLEADGGSVELRALCFNRPRVSDCCASPTEYTGVCFELLHAITGLVLLL